MNENRVDYLVAGASHAALSALAAIRMHDPAGSLAVLASMGAKEPLVHELLFNPQVIDVERVEAALAARAARPAARFSTPTRSRSMRSSCSRPERLRRPPTR